MMSDGMTEAAREEFKVGDRVKYVGKRYISIQGNQGTILGRDEENEDFFIVDLGDYHGLTWSIKKNELEKLGDDWNEERQDIVGQNGNDGSHYGVSIDEATPQDWDSTNPFIKAAKALDKQIGGDHYSKLKIQPVEYIHANNIPFIEGCIIKYATRWREKGKFKDLEKIKHFCDLLMELEENK